MDVKEHGGEAGGNPVAQAEPDIAVYLEIGKKRTFAGAVDWPGWSRSGRDEASALQTLLHYAARYAGVLRSARLGFRVPASPAAFSVVERLPGDATTDFGAPGIAPVADARPVDDLDVRRFQAILRACWQAFDVAVSAAAGKELRVGPRGGGRALPAIVRHVVEVDTAYLSRVGSRLEELAESEPDSASKRARQAILEALSAAGRGELPARGPRGGAYWTPRYLVRRVAWHALDHAWEIEDRAV
jgi:hypothetical protein